MKQPMSYGKGKAHKIRKTRAMAATLKSRSQKYKFIEKWEEENQGSPDYRIKITLVEGMSFDKFTYTPFEFFKSVGDAMRGMCDIHYATEEMIFFSKKSDTEKLQSLVKLTEKLKALP